MSLKKILKNDMGFSMVEALAAVAIIGVAALGVGSVLKSVADARIKNQTASQMLELESQILRSLQNYNSFECNASGGLTAKQQIINAVQSTAAAGTVLRPLAGFKIPLITSTTTAIAAPAVCGLDGFTLAGNAGADGKTYFSMELNYLGNTTVPNGAVFEVLSDLQCDGPAYNAAADQEKSCAVAYQIKVVDDPANPGRNNLNIIPIGTMIWSPSSGGGFPTRTAATDFSSGIGGSDFNFFITTDVFRKVSATDVTMDYNSCKDKANALFITGYDRDSATVTCAKLPTTDPGCAANEVPVGLRYDVATGEVRTNCVAIYNPVKCPDSRYVIQKVDLKALDSRYSPAPIPPGTCTWAGPQSETHQESAPADGFIEATLCPKDYIASGVSCSVSVAAADTNDGSCTYYTQFNYVDAPCYGTVNNCYAPPPAPPPPPPAPPDPMTCPHTVMTAPGGCGSNQCQIPVTMTQSASNLSATGVVTAVAGVLNRYRCTASSLVPQSCTAGAAHASCTGLTTMTTSPSWKNPYHGTFTLSATCTKSATDTTTGAALPNVINAVY